MKSLGQVFVRVAEAIADAEISDINIETRIADVVRPRSAGSKIQSFANPELFKSIRRKLFGAGLIELQPMKFLNQPNWNEWSLTDYGQAQYGLLSRLNLQSAGKSDS